MHRRQGKKFGMTNEKKEGLQEMIDAKNSGKTRLQQISEVISIKINI